MGDQKYSWCEYKKKSRQSDLLTVLTLAGIVFGVVFGLSIKESGLSQRGIAWVVFGGEIYLRMLQALSLPLIFSCVIAALGSVDLRLFGKVGGCTALYYLLSTLCASILGVVVVISFHPGIGLTPDNQLFHNGQYKTSPIVNGDVMMDLIRNLFPSNLFQATIFQYETILNVPTPSQIQEMLTTNKTIDISNYKSSFRYAQGTNFLGLTLFSVVVSLALARMGKYGKPLLELCHCLAQLLMIISDWILWLSPVGIFCLMAGRILEIDSVQNILSHTGMYALTVIFGLVIHGLLVLPTIFYVISGSHPFKLIGNISQALATAFGTSSSVATLPATISCLENNHRVDYRVTRFVLPLGAVINMDGTALYEAVAALFLAQYHNIPMDFGLIVAVCFIAAVSSIGASGIVNSGLVTMTMLINILGLPSSSLAILLPCDLILARARTTVNVLGDAIGAGLVDLLCKDDLNQGSDENTTESRTELNTNPSEEEARIGNIYS